MQEQHKKYGLVTAVAVIVGTVIGSGIFFKSDDILVLTGGNILLGAAAFCVAAFAIVFGSLAFSELAALTDKPGGLITYADEFSTSRAACVVGWFQTFIYYPSLIAVVSWVVGVYTGLLFGLALPLEGQMLIGFGFCAVCYLYNTFSPRFGGIFQRFSTVAKLLPLIAFALIGVIFGDPTTIIPAGTGRSLASFSWLAALAPIAFSFDGWIVATSIAHEIRDSKRNLRRALVMGPLFILLAYLLYFVGVSTLLGPEQVMAMGDAHIDQLAIQVLGKTGSKLVLIFVIISVMGTVNGLTLGSIRMPYALSLRGMVPGATKLQQISKKFDMPLRSGLMAFLLASGWFLLHYLTQKFGLLPNSDVSEVPVAISYLLYVFFYGKVISLHRSGRIPGKIRGVLVPLLASLGSLIILYGGAQNPAFFPYALLCALLLGGGLLYLHPPGHPVLKG